MNTQERIALIREAQEEIYASLDKIERATKGAGPLVEWASFSTRKNIRFGVTRNRPYGDHAFTIDKLVDWMLELDANPIAGAAPEASKEAARRGAEDFGLAPSDADAEAAKERDRQRDNAVLVTTPISERMALFDEV